MGLASLLTELAKVQRQHGPDSPEVEEFVKQHSADEEFVGLAQISRALRKALAVQPMTRVIRPKATHLQFLILTGIKPHAGISGRDLRAFLAAQGEPMSGPRFYQHMARMKDTGFVTGSYEEREVTGDGFSQTVLMSQYQITEAGQEAWQSNIDFYQGHHSD